MNVSVLNMPCKSGKDHIITIFSLLTFGPLEVSDSVVVPSLGCCHPGDDKYVPPLDFCLPVQDD